MYVFRAYPNFHTPKNFQFLLPNFVTLYITKEAIKAYLILP